MRHRDALEQLLLECARRAQMQPLSLGEALDRMEQSGFALVVLLLCLPFLQPLPLGPLSAIGGGAITALGWQMWRGRAQPWLPQRLRQITPAARLWQALLGVCRWLVHWMARLTRVRLSHWTDGALGSRSAGALICSGGLLLAVPMPVAPFSNALPALGIICAAVALLERDGLMLVASVIWQLAALLYFALIIWAWFVLGSNVWDWLGQPGSSV